MIMYSWNKFYNFLKHKSLFSSIFKTRRTSAQVHQICSRIMIEFLWFKDIQNFTFSLSVVHICSYFAMKISCGKYQGNIDMCQLF
jgi:hypothetical protein